MSDRTTHASIKTETTIRIPTPLRGFTGGADEVTLEGLTTVGEALRELGRRHEGILERILDAEGRVR